MSVKALLSGKIARRAGTVVLALVALDLIATVATLTVGAQWLRR